MKCYAFKSHLDVLQQKISNLAVSQVTAKRKAQVALLGDCRFGFNSEPLDGGHVVLTVNKLDKSFVIPLSKNPVHLLSRTISQVGKITLGHACFEVGRIAFTAALHLYQLEQPKR